MNYSTQPIWESVYFIPDRGYTYMPILFKAQAAGRARRHMSAAKGSPKVPVAHLS